jgi:hypothetical protein
MKHIVLSFFCLIFNGCFFISLASPALWQGPRVSSSDVLGLLESGVMTSGDIYEVEGVISLKSHDRFSIGEYVYFDLPDASQGARSMPAVGEHVVIVGRVFLDGNRARISDAFYSKVNTRRPARRILLPANQ